MRACILFRNLSWKEQLLLLFSFANNFTLWSSRLPVVQVPTNSPNNFYFRPGCPLPLFLNALRITYGGGKREYFQQTTKASENHVCLSWTEVTWNEWTICIKDMLLAVLGSSHSSLLSAILSNRTLTMLNVFRCFRPCLISSEHHFHFLFSDRN